MTTPQQDYSLNDLPGEEAVRGGIKKVRDSLKLLLGDVEIEHNGNFISQEGKKEVKKAKERIEGTRFTLGWVLLVAMIAYSVCFAFMAAIGGGVTDFQTYLLPVYGIVAAGAQIAVLVMIVYVSVAGQYTKNITRNVTIVISCFLTLGFASLGFGIYKLGFTWGSCRIIGWGNAGTGVPTVDVRSAVGNICVHEAWFLTLFVFTVLSVIPVILEIGAMIYIMNINDNLALVYIYLATIGNAEKIRDVLRKDTDFNGKLIPRPSDGKAQIYGDIDNNIASKVENRVHKLSSQIGSLISAGHVIGKHHHRHLLEQIGCGDISHHGHGNSPYQAVPSYSA